ncbi:MAG: hypothetical protein ABR509_07205 [Candidatus Limnocylindria bacterium]
MLDADSAFVQDDTAALLLRVPDDVTLPGRDETVELSGTRSSKAGMLSLRVEAATAVGHAAAPSPIEVATGALVNSGEDYEARLVRVAGVVASPRLSSLGNLSFTIDDGSGPLRVFVYASTGIDAVVFEAGAWFELRGVLGQETSGDNPTEGYRLWPRDSGDVRLVAPATAAGGSAGQAATADRAADGGSDGAIGEVRDPDGQDLGSLVAPRPGESGGPAAATLVLPAWPELDLAALLWDGSTAVGVRDSPDARDRVRTLLDGRRPPLVVSVDGEASAATWGPLAGWTLTLSDPGALETIGGSPRPPATSLPSEPAAAWTQLLGRLEIGRDSAALRVDGASVPVELQCEDASSTEAWSSLDGKLIRVTGLAGDAGGGVMMLVPCSGFAAAPTLAADGSGLSTDRASAASAERDIREPSSEVDAGMLLVGAGVATMLTSTLIALAWRNGTIGRVLARFRPEEPAGEPREERPAS